MSNEEFLEFVSDGGYSKPELWTEEGRCIVVHCVHCVHCAVDRARGRRMGSHCVHCVVNRARGRCMVVHCVVDRGG